MTRKAVSTKAKNGPRVSYRRPAALAALSTEWQWEADADFRFTYLSSGFERLAAAEPEAWLGQRPSDLGASNIDAMTAVADNSRIFSDVTLEYLSKAQGRRGCRLSGRVRLDRHGHRIGYYGVGTAVPVLTQFQHMQHAQELLFDAMESISEGFALYDADDRLVLFNSRYQFMADRPISAIRPGSLFREVVAEAVARGCFNSALEDPEGWMAQRLNYHRNPVGVFEVELRDGRWMQIVDRRTPSGGIVTVNTDITVRKKRVEAEQRAQTLQALGQLVSGVAHDLSNVLLMLDCTVQNLGDTLREGRDPTLLLNSCSSTMSLANGVVNRLLVFAHRKPVKPQRIDARELLRRLTDLLRHTIGSGIDIALHFSGNRFNVYADPQQLETTLLNLSLNARDAMQTGGLLRFDVAEVELDAHWAMSRVGMVPGTYLRIDVCDNGRGMTKDVIGRAFEPFFTTKGMGKGTGLGLSMAYSFVKESNGEIEIDSELTQGTRIRIYLPLETRPGTKQIAG